MSVTSDFFDIEMRYSALWKLQKEKALHFYHLCKDYSCAHNGKIYVYVCVCVSVYDDDPKNEEESKNEDNHKDEDKKN